MSAPHARLDELAAGTVDVEDVRTLRRLAALYDRLDPVPAGLVDRVNFGLTLDALHAEIADLQRSADLVGVRAADASEAQTVTFTSSTFTTMITITQTAPDEVRIDGWVAPAERISVELRTGVGTHRTDTDDDGRFVLTSVPRGLAQLTLRPADPDLLTVVTPSIEL
jgi:hypothetical protein